MAPLASSYPVLYTPGGGLRTPPLADAWYRGDIQSGHASRSIRDRCPGLGSDTLLCPLKHPPSMTPWSMEQGWARPPKDPKRVQKGTPFWDPLWQNPPDYPYETTVFGPMGPKKGSQNDPKKGPKRGPKGVIWTPKTPLLALPHTPPNSAK
jgi:hypothetical protein